MTATVATVKDIGYYDKEEVKQDKTKKGRKDKENYYSESGTAQSIYLGSGSKELKLFGKCVSKGDLQKLVNGVNPHNNQLFFKANKAKFQATDMCLSAPKDFTMLAEFDTANKEKYQEIFDKAVERTINKLEEKVYRRARQNGGTKNLHDCKLVVLSFQHKTARQVGENRPDPQWHRHNVILRRCFDGEGNVKTIDNYGIFNNQKLMGAVFRSELANGLREIGFSIKQNKEDFIDDDFKRVKVNSFKVEGITDTQRNIFSNRKQAIDKVAGDSATSVKKYSVAQNIKRAKVLWDDNQLRQLWNNDANSVGFNGDFISGLKTNSKNTYLNTKLEEYLIKSSMSKGKLYESKLRLRLQEYEQFTGINADKYFQRLIDTKAIERVKGFEFKCNLDLNKYDTKQKIIVRRLNSDYKTYENKFTEFQSSINTNTNMLLMSYLIYKMFDDKPKKNKQEEPIVNKKVHSESPKVKFSNIEKLQFSIADIEFKMRKYGITAEEYAQLNQQLIDLYYQLAEEKKRLAGIDDFNYNLGKIKPK